MGDSHPRKTRKPLKGENKCPFLKFLFCVLTAGFEKKNVKNGSFLFREEAVVEIELDSDGVLAAPLKEGRAQQELEVTVVQRRRSRRSNAGNRMMSLGTK